MPCTMSSPDTILRPSESSDVSLPVHREDRWVEEWLFNPKWVFPKIKKIRSGYFDELVLSLCTEVIYFLTYVNYFSCYLGCNNCSGFEGGVYCSHLANHLWPNVLLLHILLLITSPQNWQQQMASPAAATVYISPGSSNRKTGGKRSGSERPCPGIDIIFL